MKNVGRVQGNTEQAKALVVGKDTVYVHTDIQPVMKDGKVVEDLFSYNEVQYSKDEYIEQLSTDLTNTQLALCEIYEALGGAE